MAGAFPRPTSVPTVPGQGCAPATLAADGYGYGYGYGDARPRTVRLAPGATRALPHAAHREHGWYDLVISAAEDRSFGRRPMGHIENGRESVTG